MYKLKTLTELGWNENDSTTDKKAILKFCYQCTITEKLFSRCFPEIYKEIIDNEKLKVLTKFQQKAYHFLNDDLDLNLGHCQVCGKPTRFKNIRRGYSTFCSFTCATSSPITQEKMKRTNLERYGCEHTLSVKEFRDKGKETCLKKYGVEFASESPIVKEKAKATFMKRYGVKAYSCTDEYKQKMARFDVAPAQRDEVKKARAATCQQRYGACCFLQSEQYFKQIRGKKSETRSKLEIGFENYLNKYGIKYETQCHSDKYPYRCDFYLPDSDLFIELNGTWTHGKCVYNPYDPNCIKKLEVWKTKSASSNYYKKAIRTWTILDIEKIQWAERHSLNFLILYYITPEECFLNTIPNLRSCDMNKIDQEMIEKVYPKNSINKQLLDMIMTLE